MLQIFGKQTETTAALQQSCGDIRLGLRWGGQQHTGAINGQVHLLDGLEQLRALQTAGVSCPVFYEGWDNEDLMRVQGGVWLGRKLNHTQGRDIIASSALGTRKRRELFMGRDFYTKYTTSVAEWRMHVVKFERGYRTIARSLKVHIDEDIFNPNGIIIRSRRLGWHMSHETDPPKGLREIAKKAVEACAYELGAVDILDLGPETNTNHDSNSTTISSNYNRFMVLETNSRPAIRDDYTLSAYTKAFITLASERS